MDFKNGVMQINIQAAGYNGARIVRNVLDKNCLDYWTIVMVKKHISPNILGICLVALGMELHVI